MGGREGPVAHDAKVIFLSCSPVGVLKMWAYVSRELRGERGGTESHRLIPEREKHSTVHKHRHVPEKNTKTPSSKSKVGTEPKETESRN